MEGGAERLEPRPAESKHRLLVWIWRDGVGASSAPSCSLYQHDPPLLANKDTKHSPTHTHTHTLSHLSITQSTIYTFGTQILQTRKRPHTHVTETLTYGCPFSSHSKKISFLFCNYISQLQLFLVIVTLKHVMTSRPAGGPVTDNRLNVTIVTTTHNCDFISHKCDFITHNFDFIHQILTLYVTVVTLLFIIDFIFCNCNYCS